MAQAFQLKHPLESRRAAEGLRQQIIDHLVGDQAGGGGTVFVGSSVGAGGGVESADGSEGTGFAESGGVDRAEAWEGDVCGATGATGGEGGVGGVGGERKGIVRMAVLVHALGDFSHDWYSPTVLAGVDEMAGEAGVTIELLGDRDCDVRAVSNRLMQSRPDVMVCLAPAARHALLIGESLRQGIPAIGTGSFLMDLGIPTICEDGEGGAADAVKHLAAMGHTRIGFVQMAFGIPLAFQRHRGYLRGLREAGLVEDESLVLWMRRNEKEEVERLRSYLKRCRPTGIVCGACWPLEYLAELVKSGEVKVPGGLSVVNFDQHPRVVDWLGGVKPTVMALPLREMGRELAKLARQVTGGGEVEKVKFLSCVLERGESVRKV